jgi:zinc protease
MSNINASPFSTSLRAALVLLPLLSVPAWSEQTLDPNVTQYTLANGLTVVLAPSRTAQSVALVTQYKVGSANEAPGRSGFAHLFEHLMFEGTKAVPDFDKVISGIGGENNAFTQEDTTTYYMTGPKEALPVFLRLDADRMANLANAVSQEDLDNQRQIVLNEMRQNVLDQPGGAAGAEAVTALYPAGHPYAHATIGSIADLGAAKLEDVVAFHRINYVPSNAIVTVTGSFDIEKTRALIEQTFGVVPKVDAPKAVAPVALAAEAQKLEFVDAVATPVVTLAWPGTAGFSKQTVINDMLSVAMTVGEKSLENRLVVQQGVASSVGMNWDSRQLGGMFTVAANGAQGVSAEKLEAGLRAALEAMRTEGISEQTLKVVRTDFETGYDRVPSSPLGFAMQLAHTALDDNAGAWRKAVDLSKTVTSEEVTAALRSFADASALVSVIKPGARNTSYPPAIANSTGVSTAQLAAARPDVVIPETAVQDAAALVFPQTETRTLASGAMLVSYHIDDKAQAGIAISTRGGKVDAPVGLARLGMAVDSRGAGDLALSDLNVRFRESGISIYGNSGSHYSQIVATAPVDKFEVLAGQLAEVVLKPRFDAKEWAAAVDQTVNGVESSRKQPDYQAGRKLVEALYPAGSPEAREPDVAALKALKSDDAKVLFQQLMRPDQTVFHVASNLPVDRIATTLDKAFSSWSAIGNAVAFNGYTRPAVKDLRIDTQVDGATQAAIMAALSAPDEGSKESTPFGLAVQVLGGDANSRLNKVLREERGWSYGIGAQSVGEKDRNNSLLYVSTTVQADHTEASIAEIRKIIAELATKPITEDEFQSAKRTMRAQFLNAFESAPVMAGFAASMASQEYALKDLQEYLAELDTVTLAEVNAQAAAIAKSPISLSVAGDKALMK